MRLSVGLAELLVLLNPLTCAVCRKLLTQQRSQCQQLDACSRLQDPKHSQGVRDPVAQATRCCCHCKLLLGVSSQPIKTLTAPLPAVTARA